MEQEGLFLFRFGDAGQAKLAAITKVEPDFHHQDGAKALQGASRGDGAGHHFKLLLKTDPQAIAEGRPLRCEPRRGAECGARLGGWPVHF